MVALPHQRACCFTAYTCYLCSWRPLLAFAACAINSGSRSPPKAASYLRVFCLDAVRHHNAPFHGRTMPLRSGDRIFLLSSVVTPWNYHHAASAG